MTARIVRVCLIAALLNVAAFANTAVAQAVQAGKLLVTVIDPTGLVLPNATITIVGVEEATFDDGGGSELDFENVFDRAVKFVDGEEILVEVGDEESATFVRLVDFYFKVFTGVLDPAAIGRRAVDEEVFQRPAVSRDDAAGGGGGGFQGEIEGGFFRVRCEIEDF